MKSIRWPAVLIALPSSVLSVLLPMHTTSLGFTALQTTTMFSVLSAFLLLFRPLAGRAVDRFGFKRLFSLSLLLYAATALLYSFGYSLPALYAARAFQGIASALFSVTTYVLISSDAGGDHERQLGKLRGYTGQGNLLGILLCFVLLYQFPFAEGWNWFFRACAAAALAAFFLALKSMGDLSTPGAGKGGWFKIPDGRGGLFGLNIVLCTANSLLGAVFALYLMEAFKADLLQIALAFLLPSVLIPFLMPYLGSTAQSWGGRKSLLAGTVLSLLSAVGLFLVQNINVFALVWTALQIALSFLGIGLDGAYMRGIPEEERGLIMGTYDAGGYGGGIIGPLVGGALFQYVQPGAPFIAGALLLLPALAFAVLRGPALGEGGEG